MQIIQPNTKDIRFKIPILSSQTTLYGLFSSIISINKSITISKKIKKIINKKRASVTNKKEKLHQYFLDNKRLYCSYCGCNQLQLYKKSFIGRKEKIQYSFQVDHFLHKEKYPQFAFDPYNLIPVCYFCNTSGMKHNRDILEECTNQGSEVGYVFHPYFGRLKIEYDQASMSYNLSIYDGEPNSFNKYMKNTGNKRNDTCPISKNHIKFFRLDGIYQGSPSVGNDIKYMHGKRKELKEQRSRLTILLSKHKVNTVNWLINNRSPQGYGDVLSYPNGKLRFDIKEWLLSNLNKNP